MQPWALEEPGRDELGEGMLGLRDQTPLGHPAPRPTSHRSEAGLRTHASQREMEVELALPGPLRVTGTPQDRASRIFQLPELWHGRLLIETKVQLMITQINL